MKRLTTLLQGVALSALTLAVVWAALEAAFPSLVPVIPLALEPFLPPGVELLSQSSKDGVVPQAYTALLGDSYAQGEGDWRLSAKPLSRPEYHSAHVYHDSGLGDVLSFGVSGAGSLNAIARAPVVDLAFLASLRRFPPLGPPKRALVYFYEGNDLNDNLHDWRERFLPAFDARRVYREDYFQAYIQKAVIEQDPVYLQATGMGWTGRQLLLPFLGEVWRHVWWRVTGQSQSWGVGGPVSAPAGRAANRARVGGATIDLPDTLQGPSLELSRHELRLTAWMFQEALVFAQRRFPGTEFVVVLVPSPLSCYALEGPRASAQSYEERGEQFPVGRVGRYSDRVTSLVQRAAARAGVRFFDARPALRRAAAAAPIHGPRDWKHLNRTGYETLAHAVIEDLARGR